MIFRTLFGGGRYICSRLRALWLCSRQTRDLSKSWRWTTNQGRTEQQGARKSRHKICTSSGEHFLWNSFANLVCAPNRNLLPNSPDIGVGAGPNPGLSWEMLALLKAKLTTAGSGVIGGRNLGDSHHSVLSASIGFKFAASLAGR